MKKLLVVMLLHFSLPLLMESYTFEPGSYNCSYVTCSIINTAGGSNCGLFPSAFQTTWTWKIQLWSTISQAPSGKAINSSVTGNGWCAALWVVCWDINTGMDTPFNIPHYPYNANSETYTWTDSVTSTPPGGAYSTGVGCAASVTTVQPATPITIDALICKSVPGSPIIIDTADEGFHLTDLLHGVIFRETAAGPRFQMSWTDPAFHNGWLALPRNGQVTSLQDLFGNLTAQQWSATPNGYLALDIYDLNHDGLINSEDPVFSRLRIWIDANHDGISQPDELHSLPEIGLTQISLHYGESLWTDTHGNQFRYTSTDVDTDAPASKRNYDVFLLTTQLPGL